MSKPRTASPIKAGETFGVRVAMSDSYYAKGSDKYRWLVDLYCTRCCTVSIGIRANLAKKIALESKRGSGCVNCRRWVHGGTGTRLHDIWKGLFDRCNPNATRNSYIKYYSGKGIKICDEWLSFENFRIWSESNGYTDDLEIDRIDADGHYEPGNCQWITHAENMKKIVRK